MRKVWKIKDSDIKISESNLYDYDRLINGYNETGENARNEL